MIDSIKNFLVFELNPQQLYDFWEFLLLPVKYLTQTQNRSRRHGGGAALIQST